jgi:hypothetical protein
MLMAACEACLNARVASHPQGKIKSLQEDVGLCTQEFPSLKAEVAGIGDQCSKLAREMGDIRSTCLEMRPLREEVTRFGNDVRELRDMVRGAGLNLENLRLGLESQEARVGAIGSELTALREAASRLAEHGPQILGVSEQVGMLKDSLERLRDSDLRTEQQVNARFDDRAAVERDFCEKLGGLKAEFQALRQGLLDREGELIPLRLDSTGRDMPIRRPGVGRSSARLVPSVASLGDVAEGLGVVWGQDGSLGEGFECTLGRWLGGGKRMTRLYQAGRRDLNKTAFHAACDGKSPTLVLVSILEGAGLLGGYTPAARSRSDSTVRGPKGGTWVFSLRDQFGDEPQRWMLADQEHFGVSVPRGYVGREPVLSFGSVGVLRIYLEPRRGNLMAPWLGRVEVLGANPDAWRPECGPGRSLLDGFVDPGKAGGGLSRSFPLKRLEVWLVT